MDPMNKDITVDTQRRRLNDAIVAIKLMFDDNQCQYINYFPPPLFLWFSCMYICKMSIIHYADLPDAGSARGIDDKYESCEDGAAQVALELFDEPICKKYVAVELPNSLPRHVENDNALLEPDFDAKSKSLQSRFEYIVPVYFLCKIFMYVKLVSVIVLAALSKTSTEATKLGGSQTNKNLTEDDVLENVPKPGKKRIFFIFTYCDDEHIRTHLLSKYI